MKKIALVPITLLLAVVFSACSIIQDALPEQKVENLLGINDSEVSTQLVAEEPETPEFFTGAPLSLLPQQAGVWMPFFVYRSVEDPTEALPFSPEALEQEVIFSSLTLTGGSDAAVFPEEISVDFGGFFLAMWDGFSAPAVNGWEGLTQERLQGMVESYGEAARKDLAFTFSTDAKSLSFSKDAANCGASSCVYTLDTDLSEDVVVLLEAAMAKQVSQILAPTGLDSDINSVAAFGTFKLNSTPLLDTGLSATVRVNTPAGVVKFN